MNDKNEFPLCRSVQQALREYPIDDEAYPEERDAESELGLVLTAYNGSDSGADERAWGWGDYPSYLQAIAFKVEAALTGCLTYRGFVQEDLRIVVAPSTEHDTHYVAFNPKTGMVLNHGCMPAHHFGHQDGSLEDLEAFFEELVPPKIKTEG